MQKYLWSVVLLAMAVSLSFGVATATAAKNGNSPDAKLCQKGGWEDLVRTNGSAFNNKQECVSYAAQGGKLEPKPTSTCTGGSDNFSDDAEFSQPTTFAGGTIDTEVYVYFPIGGFSGNSLWSIGDSSQLTFTNAVHSVELDAESNNYSFETHQTLTAYDASNNVVDTDSATQPAEEVTVHLSVEATGNNIKYFTIATDGGYGVFFSNIEWCAA